MSTSLIDLWQLLMEMLRSPGFQRASFGGPRRGGPDSDWLRIRIRAIEIDGQRTLQFEYFDSRQSYAKNLRGKTIDAALNELLDLQFSAIHVVTMTEEIDVRVSKKGKLFVGRKAVEAMTKIESHNRKKDLPLPEGESNRLLEAMGILGSDGRVKPTMRAKFSQINEFLKHLLHVLDDANLRSLGHPIEILDCGCGSSYLTLAVHHYLNDILHLPANLLGVDVNDEVIRKSVERAERLGAESLKFVCDRIDAIRIKPDVVIALHACDTATDAALAAAINNEAKLILSAPCCHHHLNEQLKPANTEVLRPILRHGILHERQADLITDAFRALILRIHGYRTDVVEFVSPEHTARNLLIRAVRTASVNEPQFVEEFRGMKAFFGVTPHLESLLPESFLLQ